MLRCAQHDIPFEVEPLPSLIRKTLHGYAQRVDASSYIVDRNTATSVYNSADQYLAHTMRFYDGNNQSSGTLGTTGRLTREIAVWNLGNRTLAQITNQQLDGRDTIYGYDSWGNQTSRTSYAGGGWVKWPGSGNWQASVPGNSSAARTTTTVYDPTFRAFPTSVTNPLWPVESAGYDYRMGTLTSVTDPNNQTTTAQYDVFGRPFTVEKPGDVPAHPTLVFLYYDAEQPVRYLVARREVAQTGYHRPLYYFYDGLGRLIQEKAESQEQAEQIVTDYRYDGRGRTTLQSQPRYVKQSGGAFTGYTPTPGSGLRWTTTAYDAVGRVSSVTAPDATVTAHRYGVEGGGLRWHDVTDPRRHRTQSRTDALGRLVQQYELSGNCASDGTWGYSCGGAFTTNWVGGTPTTYTYSPLDLLTQVTDAKSNVTSLSYDSLGRKTNTVDRDMGAWWYGYDANGNLTSQTDAKNDTTFFGYDTLERLTSKSGSGWANYYAYDQAFGAGIGRRTATSSHLNGNQQTYQNFTYDSRGRVAGTSISVTGAPARTFGYTYDSGDRLTSLTYPNNEVVSYTYDAGWHQTSVCGTSCYVSSATYTALNQPSQWCWGNNVLQTWNYDPSMARLDRLRIGLVGQSNPNSIFERTYVYDGVGNLALSSNLRTGLSTSYSYDHRDRLTFAGGNEVVDESYSYDVIGNLLQRASSQGTTSYSYGSTGNGTGAGPHQARTIGGQTYSYDANGNLTSGGGRGYTWDGENRPTLIGGGGIVDENYTYDADSRRVKITTSQGTTLYLEGMWDENVGTGAVKQHYLLDGKVVAVRRTAGGTSTLTQLHGDPLGSISVATNTRGAVLSQQEFDPWGKVRSGGVAETNRNYTGQLRDGTGLLYYNARYYYPGRLTLANWASNNPDFQFCWV